MSEWLERRCDLQIDWALNRVEKTLNGEILSQVDGFQHILQSNWIREKHNIKTKHNHSAAQPQYSPDISPPDLF